MKGFYQMNSDLLAAFLKDQASFVGSALELYARLKRRPEFRTLPACGEDFYLELRRQEPALRDRDVDVAFFSVRWKRVRIEAKRLSPTSTRACPLEERCP
jgi:hypothetical protein